MFIDIHSHKWPKENTRNTTINIIPLTEIKRNHDLKLNCIGIHPWDIDKVASIEDFYKELQINDQLFAIGEVGLDKARFESWDKQLLFFRYQVEFARINKINKIIVHCVQAYTEVYKTINQASYDGQVLFHDFNSTIEMKNEIQKHVNASFSFGSKVFNEKTKAALTLKNINLEEDCIFFETDDQDTYSIEQIYTKASEITNTPLKKLQNIISKNFEAFTSHG